MPRAPLPLDDEWRQPFRVRDARAAGISDARLRRSDLPRRFHGARSLPETTALESYAALLRPGERFSHTTAAAIWGAPLPRSADGPLHVLAGYDLNRVRRPGVIGHRGVGQPVHRSGVPVSAPTDLVAELGTILSLDDLVAVIDHLVLEPRVQLLGDPRPHVDLEELRDRLSRRRGPGIRRARQAAAEARLGAESRRETWLRRLAAASGLPEPECNAELGDAAGRIGWFDLVWRRWRIASEYDGDQHRTSTLQYDRDITRFDRAAAIGWHVVRVRNDGFHDPAATRQRLLSAFRARGWRPDSRADAA